MIEILLVIFSGIVLFCLYETRKSKLKFSNITHVSTRDKLDIEKSLHNRNKTPNEKYHFRNIAKGINNPQSKMDYLRLLHLELKDDKLEFITNLKNIGIKSKKGRTNVYKSNSKYRGLDKETKKFV